MLLAGCRQILRYNRAISYNTGIYRIIAVNHQNVCFNDHRYDENMQKRYYRNFGHGRQKTPMPRTVVYLVTVVGLLGIMVDWRWLKTKLAGLLPRVDAAENLTGFEEDQDVKEEEQKKKKSKKKKIGFRARKIMEYENRLRLHSTQDKIFRYFATVEIVESQSRSEIYMTPDDLLRAIAPGIKQPDGLGLDRYKRVTDPTNVRIKSTSELGENSIFHKLGHSGLITFSDYIFLITVLSTSRRHFEIAFRMFDLNGDGEVDSEEFSKVAALIRQQTSIGHRHRENVNNGNGLLKGVNSALTTYFFGPNRTQKLTIEKFLDFQQQLQKEILSLEFERQNPDTNGNITAADFTELLLAYSRTPEIKKKKIMKRVKKSFKDDERGISKEDYLKFFHFINNINDVDTALTFYRIAGAAIDRATMKHVAQTVAGVELNDHLIQVVYTIFDDNMDGQLSYREFVSVMKNRVLRGLSKPKDTGFFKILKCMAKCTHNSAYAH